MLDYKGRVAVVSGSSYGMGRVTALMMAERGARLVVNGRTKSKVDDLVKEITSKGGQAFADYSDVGQDAAHLVKTAIDNYGQLDIAVCNAAYIIAGLFSEQDPSLWWDIFNVSFKGSIELTRAAWPYLVKSGSGRVILFSSSGIWTNPGGSAYGAAKGAAWAFGNTLAAEGDRDGVQVSTIMPTAYTPMVENAFTDELIKSTCRDFLGPEHVAGFITYLCHQDTKVHGEMWEVSGGRAGRMVMCALPRVQSPESTPEGWVGLDEALKADSDNLKKYRVTGEQFADEMIIANPAVAEAFAGTNPADLGA